MEEPEGPGLPPGYMTTTTMRKRCASCFTRRVRTTIVPKGFKLPHDQQKYDRSQEPSSWLSDYLQAVRILGRPKETEMQSLQVHLTGAAQSRLSKLERETIRSWEELTKQFTWNFKSTYKRLASIEEVKACVQKRNETLRHTFKGGASSRTLQSKFQMSKQSMPSHLGYSEET
jgi:hypothetical protein